MANVARAAASAIRRRLPGGKAELKRRVGTLIAPLTASVDHNEQGRDRWVAQIAAQLPDGARVLDVGAGTGRYRHLFAHCTYLSHDFAQYEGTSVGPLRDEWHYDRLDYVSDITALPLDDASVDAILCTEVLEHVPEPIAAIREMVRLLRPGGRIFLSAPLGSGLHQEPYHFYGGYTPHFYRKVLSENGCAIDRITPNGGFFLHFQQEAMRANRFICERMPGIARFPVRAMSTATLGVLAPRLFMRLDERWPIEEFTVGYFVEATKSRAGNER